MRMLVFLIVSGLAATAAETQTIQIRFQAMAGAEPLACGKSYANIGTTRSTIRPRDFRFYAHGVRLVDDAGGEAPLALAQDGLWQLDDVALLDFEDATGACSNGTPAMNAVVTGTVPAGRQWRGLRFTLGVPFEKNHTDLLKMPSPLNLTALSWSWNAGRKFARLDFSSTGVPRGYAIHLGSTGCQPDDSETTVPTRCGVANRPVVALDGFDPARDVVVADLAELLKDSDVDQGGRMMSGCMSGPKTAACAPIFAHLGLAFGEQAAAPQTFFRAAKR